MDGHRYTHSYDKAIDLLEMVQTSHDKWHILDHESWVVQDPKYSRICINVDDLKSLMSSPFDYGWGLVDTSSFKNTNYKSSLLNEEIEKRF